MYGHEAYEVGLGFAGTPVYGLELPGKWSMGRLVRRTARTARRRGPSSVTIQLTRPLDEESCYSSYGTVNNQDIDDVGGRLRERFGRRGLEVTDLRLEFLRVVEPRSKAARSDYPPEPYDVVEATFTVQARSGQAG